MATGADDPDPLNGVRPGRRRSFWLREALPTEPPSLAGDVATAPFAGRARADVAILGGEILAALATGRAKDDEAANLPIVGARTTPRAFPPEPLRGRRAGISRGHGPA